MALRWEQMKVQIIEAMEEFLNRGCETSVKFFDMSDRTELGDSDKGFGIVKANSMF